MGVIVDGERVLVMKLSNGTLTTLPESFGQLRNLQKLNLRSDGLTTLPEPILGLKNLQRLILYNNRFNKEENLFVINL
ncbi:MAG: hypothetical protein GF329_01145 [Candidatus Lokiarchaeota archaeon]|nr:hypothetical protein [Candidatus Lokiarchaeota archaeon]